MNNLQKIFWKSFLKQDDDEQTEAFESYVYFLETLKTTREKAIELKRIVKEAIEVGVKLK